MQYEVWRKATASGQGNCVEVMRTCEGDSDVVLVRDSKNPDTTVLAFTAGQWDAFLIGIRAGRFGIEK